MRRCENEAKNNLNVIDKEDLHYSSEPTHVGHEEVVPLRSA